MNALTSTHLLPIPIDTSGIGVSVLIIYFTLLQLHLSYFVPCFTYDAFVHYSDIIRYSFYLYTVSFIRLMNRYNLLYYNYNIKSFLAIIEMTYIFVNVLLIILIQSISKMNDAIYKRLASVLFFFLTPARLTLC